MRWLRFFVDDFRDIYWFAENNRCYLSKKYELLINLNLYVNWYVNWYEIMCKMVCELI